MNKTQLLSLARLFLGFEELRNKTKNKEHNISSLFRHFFDENEIKILQSIENSEDANKENLKYLDGIFGKNTIFKPAIFSSSSIYATDKTNSQTNKDEYLKLYQEFLQDLSLIDSKENLITSLDYLSLKYTSFVPSFEQSSNFTPLYDKTKAQIFFESSLRLYNEKKESTEKDEKEFLLISGDFFGIQKFIFEDVPTSKVSKLLRGKSAFIQIFTKIIALKICEDIGLSSLNIINFGAGKFRILAPNLKDIKNNLEDLQDRLNKWFIKNTFGLSGLGLCSVEANKEDIFSKDTNILEETLRLKSEEIKFNKFNLINTNPILDFDKEFTKDNAHLCKTCNKRFMQDADKKSCSWCEYFIKLGENLAKKDFININKSKQGLEVFEDFYIDFAKTPSKNNGQNTIYDISNNEEFKGYAKWSLKSYVKTNSQDEVENFENLAKMSCQDKDSGVKALMCLKGDIDNMGLFFAEQKEFSFYKRNFISRLIDYFFSVKTSQMMKNKNIYTVFAGGDDIFLLGAWDEIIEFSKELDREFKNFVKGSSLSISMGMMLFKSSVPINYIAKTSEEYLENAKEIDGKDALSLFGECVKWKDYNEIKELQKFYTLLSNYDEENALSTGFIYDLLSFIAMSINMKKYEGKKMAEHIENGSFDMRDAMWKSKLNYAFTRNVKIKEKDKKEEFLILTNSLIEKNPKALKMKIFELIYKRRK